MQVVGKLEGQVAFFGLSFLGLFFPSTKQRVR